MPIGAGGMGEIYRAEDVKLGRPVAVKLLAARFADDEASRARFTREALAAARLSGHPNIVTIYDVGEWDGRPFIVMEYLAGGTVADRIGPGGVTPDEALAWLRETAEALDTAHRRGVVHRDVKPANLLLDADGHVHVSDFGIARVVDETTSGLTIAGSIVGTAGYLSPEQARGERVTSASDRYALGVVAFELLTGTRPFQRESDTAEAAAHVSDPVPRASERSRVPPAVDDVLARALAKGPEERYASAAALVEALAWALRGEPTRATVPLAPRAVHRRPRRLPLLAAAGLILAGAGGAVLAAAVVDDGAPQAGEKPGPVVTEQVTEVRTEVLTTTLPGETVVDTVVETATVAAPAEQPAPAPAAQGDGHALNDEGYALMNQGRWAEALPLLEQAVRDLRGVGPEDPYEAYANYNLGVTLVRPGRCEEAMKPLRRSDRLQDREELDRALAEAQACAGRGRDKDEDEDED